MKTKQQLQQILTKTGTVEIIDWITASRGGDCSLLFQPGDEMLLPDAFKSNLDERLINEHTKPEFLEVTAARIGFRVDKIGEGQ